MSRCSATASLLEAYSDGELPLDRLVEVERHVFECKTCSAHVGFSRAVRVSTQTAVRAAAVPSQAFRDRLSLALSAERERSALNSRAPSKTRKVQPLGVLPWRAVLPLAAAAAGVVVWNSWKSASIRAPEMAETRSEAGRDVILGSMASAANVDQLIDELLDYHAQAKAPQITEPSMVSRFEPEIGLPVRVPRLQDYGALWEGGSVVPMRTSSGSGVVSMQAPPRAASLRYTLGDHRITVYVYDSSRFPLRARLEPRVVGNVPVYVGTRRGYSIAATEGRGVGYALASDLPDPESAELVAATVMH